jgi:hypothetical protein
VVLSAVITNAGARGVPAGVQVEFLETAPTQEVVGTLATQRPLLPGGSERLTVTAKNIMSLTNYEFLVRVDGPGAPRPVAECKEDDNSDTARERCDIIP